MREPRRPTRHADVAMDMSRSRAQAAYAATVDNRRASHRWPHRLHRHPPPAASASLLKDSSVVWHSRHVACRRTTGSASRSAGAACDSGTLRTITYSRFGGCEFGAARCRYGRNAALFVVRVFSRAALASATSLVRCSRSRRGASLASSRMACWMAPRARECNTFEIRITLNSGEYVSRSSVTDEALSSH